MPVPQRSIYRLTFDDVPEYKGIVAIPVISRTMTGMEIEREVPQLCACGCEEYAGINKARGRGYNKFITGHNGRVPASQGNRKHGMFGTPTYYSWAAMLTRCRNPNEPAYARYGGRGITVCERWHDFRNFHADMGDKPSGMTIDRIDNDGNYEPGNCRWATYRQQNRNKRTTVLTQERANLIRSDATGRTYKEIGNEFGVSRAQVGFVRRGRNWVN